jgi:AcrR family transcriptional regulator
MSIREIDSLGPQGRAKRAQMIEAARQLFLERGFERTSMDAIRDRAGVSKATLYNHYQNKEVLFADVVRTIVNDVMSDWLPMLVENAPKLRSREDLRQALIVLAQHALRTMMSPEYLALIRVVVSEMNQFPQLSEIYRVAGPESGITIFSHFLEQARARGLATFDDASTAARLLIGSLLSYALIDGLLVAGPPSFPPSVPIEALIDLFMRAIAPADASTT